MYRVIIGFGDGSLTEGFNLVSVQLIDSQGVRLLKREGELPANPELMHLYQSWKQQYRAHYMERSLGPTRLEFFPEVNSRLAFSEEAFQDCCDRVQAELETWVTSPVFLRISNLLRSRLNPEQSCQWIIESKDPIIQNLPWHLWSLFQDYPLAEFAVSLPSFDQVQTENTGLSEELKILTILGTSTDTAGQDLDIQTDRKIMESVSQVSTVVANQISLAELADLLWTHEWDAILFSGHSAKASTEDQTGFLLDSDGSQNLMTVSALESSFQAAIQKGLKLVIFNSCDSFDLGLDLLRLNLPVCITMGEVVPDVVAQRFLNYLVQQWSIHNSLLTAFRNARARLKESEDPTLPCSSWLPIMCQNPSAPLPSWPVKPKHQKALGNRGVFQAVSRYVKRMGWRGGKSVVS